MNGIEVTDEEQTTKEIGGALEKTVEFIFTSSGFQTKRNARLAKYEIDVLASIGDRKIIIECKNYQKSNITIRNIIHQWNSKNEIIKANKIIIVFAGKKIKKSDKVLANKFNIELWDDEDLNSLLSLTVKPPELKKRLLQKISFKPVKISELYNDKISEFVIYPLLSDKEEDEEMMYGLYAKWLKIFIRTELQLRETSREERTKHIQLFEDTKIKRGFFKIESEMKPTEYWSNLANKLQRKNVLSKNTQMKYYGYMKDILNEYRNQKKYFKGNSELFIRRLIQGRIYNSLKSKNYPICLFGFNEKQTVEIVPLEEGNFFIKVEDLDDKQIEIINWITTSESFLTEKTTDQGVSFEVNTWICRSINKTSEKVFRILDEYYGFEEGEKLYDYSLVDKSSKGCFIATAAYGTPFSDEIKVLKNWRDASLKNSFLGNIFIEIYYSISPYIARVIENKNSLKRFTRKMLSPVIKHLKRKYS